MAEQGISTGGKHRAHPSSGLGELGDSDGENPTMKGLQPTSPRAMQDRARGEAQMEELGARHDSVLPARQPAYRLIQVLVRWARYSNAKGPEPLIHPPFLSRFSGDPCRRWDSNPHAPKGTAF